MTAGRVSFVLAFYCALSAAMGVPLYWYFIDTDPPYRPVSVRVLNINGEPTRTFQRGETMLIKRENCGSREDLLHFSRELKRVGDDLTFVMPSGAYLVELGCRTTINAPQIPTYVQPGRYQYIVSTRYTNNPLHSGLILLKVFEIDIE